MDGRKFRLLATKHLDPPLRDVEADGSSLPCIELLVVFLMAVLEKGKADD
jgi:hypothetical protein